MEEEDETFKKSFKEETPRKEGQSGTGDEGDAVDGNAVKEEKEATLMVTTKGDVVLYIPRLISRSPLFMRKYSQRRVSVALLEGGCLVVKPHSV